MIRQNIRRQVFSWGTIIAIVLLYFFFMMGKSDIEIDGEKATTIIGAIIGKTHGRWETNSSTVAAVRMKRIWTDNRYICIFLPIIMGIPFINNYITEVKTQNKRFVLIRSTVKEYWFSKILSTIITATIITFVSILLYDITLLVCFEPISSMGEDAEWIRTIVAGENASDMDVFFSLVKNNFYFILFANVCAAFAFLTTLVSSDIYLTLGATVLVVYFQYRLYEGLIIEYMRTQKKIIGDLADAINPGFLNYAGQNGFYKDKEAIAVMIEIAFVILLYTISYIYYSRQRDLCAK